MRVNAYAKINRYLNITGKREDGYHDIITEMQEIDIADTVTVHITDCGNIRVSCDNPLIPSDNRNIAYRAAELFRQKIAGLIGERSERLFGVNVDIQKRIPLMAGLGGSSTDGAAVLKVLSSLCESNEYGLRGISFSKDELMKMGAELGSDVPFFLVGGRAECTGTGVLVTPLPDLPPQYYAIIQPDFYCDTKAAYELFDKSMQISDDKSGNVFQRLYRLYYKDERIERICSFLMRNGAEYASMSGSGSAVYGIFSDEESAKYALAVFEKEEPFYKRYLAKNVIRGGV